MAKGSRCSWALALVLSPALWVLPGTRPAVAHPSGDPACYLPPFSLLVSPCVPHDVPAGSAATVADLAFFAWQEFIALNWVAEDPGNTGIRGRPAPATDPNAGFFGVAPDATGDFPLVVWQTYRHKNELFPADGNTDISFDSVKPTYKYANPPSPASGTPAPNFHLFNNLDETSQLGLDNMYAHATSAVQPPFSGPGAGPATGIRVAYEAKVNRAVFDYANSPLQGFTNPAGNYQKLNTALSNTGPIFYIGDPYSQASQFAGICSTASPLPIVMLPCGDINVPGDPGEGAIEIKAAWRQLTDDEVKKGRFFTRNVIFYTGPQGSQKYNNGVWGLVALHIIHKTKSFPAFVFATWEQIDNYDDDTNTNSENLAFQNTGTPLANIPLTRAHAIHSQVASTNDSVHATFKAADPNTIWQYYKLIGVQATPVNKPPATASADDLSYYYLANIMVETNQPLQNFTGQIAGGVTADTNNVYLKGAAGPFQMGGCQGCHGFQAQYLGGDMSRLLSAGPTNAQTAESIDSGATASVRTYRYRSKDILLPKKGTPLPGEVSRWHFRHGTVLPVPKGGN